MMPTIEAQALTAVLDGDEDALNEVLGKMLPGERIRLADAARLLYAYASQYRERSAGSAGHEHAR